MQHFSHYPFQGFKTVISNIALLAFLILLSVTLAGCGVINIGDLFPADTPIPTAVPLVPTPTPRQGPCDTGYWPIVKGATWVYNLVSMSGNVEGVETRQITRVEEDQFRLLISSAYRSEYQEYHCRTDGIYDANGVLVLPAEGQIRPDAKWQLSTGMSLTMVGYTDVTVPAGSFQAASFTVEPGASYVDYWTKGVGLVYVSADLSRELVSYSIGDESSEPGQAQDMGEARIRYILADAQLGGGIETYREATDPESIEAVRRWEQGIRVTNIDDFERIEVGALGWQVVYLETETTIDGMDANLSEPPEKGYCGNTYWPIVKDANWSFEGGFTWTIEEVVPGENNSATFVVNDTGQRKDYYCDATGIYFVDEGKHELVLPSEPSIILGFTYSDNNNTYYYLWVEAITSATVSIRTDEGLGGLYLQFTKDIGPTSIGTYSGDGPVGPYFLVTHNIP